MDVQARMFLHRGKVRPASYNRELLDYMPPRVNCLLDLGCGAGELALELAERSEFVVGLDPSAALLDIARQRQRELGRTNVGWVLARAEELPFASASFDFVISVNVLRLTDKVRVLEHLKRVIRPGGRLALKDHLKSPEPFGFWLSYLGRILKSMSSWLRSFGWKSLLEMLRYRLSAEGVAQSIKSESLTGVVFAEICRDTLRGCHVEITAHSGVVLWERG